jgi:hypothetical protein
MRDNRVWWPTRLELRPHIRRDPQNRLLAKAALVLENDGPEGVLRTLTPRMHDLYDDARLAHYRPRVRAPLSFPAPGRDTRRERRRHNFAHKDRPGGIGDQPSIGDRTPEIEAVELVPLRFCRGSWKRRAAAQQQREECRRSERRGGRDRTFKPVASPATTARQFERGGSWLRGRGSVGENTSRDGSSSVCAGRL